MLSISIRLAPDARGRVGQKPVRAVAAAHVEPEDARSLRIEEHGLHLAQADAADEDGCAHEHRCPRTVHDQASYPSVLFVEPCRADERDEPARNRPCDLGTVRPADDDLQPLIVEAADRDDDAAADGELVVERLRDGGGGGRDRDPVEGRTLGHAQRAVADPDLDALVACPRERFARPLRELRHALDRHDLRRDLSQHRRLVTRAGAHIQDACLWPELERGADRGDHERLRDRLPMADRKRAIGVGATPQLLGNEQLARHGGDRSEHSRVGDTATPEVRGEVGACSHARAGTRAYAGSATPKCSSAAGITSTIEPGSVSSPTVSIGTSESPASSEPCEPPPE